MSTLFALVVPFAGCAVMMLLCTRMMRRGDCSTATPTQTAELDQLRAEVAELHARLATDNNTDQYQHPVR